MSIYITKDGQKKKVNISATDVQLLDIDGRFKSKNLEDALKEVGSGTEENMTRIENKVEEKLHYPLKEVEDLNNEITASSFSFNNVPLNSPDNSAYYCDVVTWGDNEAFVEQTLRSIAYDTIYKRVKNARGWQPWRKYLFSDEIANPNLLINGDFQVWQRGESFTDTKRGQYSADRWMCTTAGHKITRLYSNSGIKIEITNTTVNSTNSIYLRQKVVSEEFKKFNNKTITLSFKARTDGTYGRIEIYDRKSGKNVCVQDMSFTPGGNKVYSATFDFNYTGTSDYLEFSFICADNKGATYLEVEYAKLELGSVATSFTPRPYAEELVLCQRYYQRFYVPQIVVPMDSNFDSRIPLIPDSTHIMRIKKPTAILITDVYAHDCSSASTTWKLADKGVSILMSRDGDNSLWLHRSHLMSDADFKNTYGFPPAGTLVSYNSSSGTSNRISGAVCGWLDAELY